MKQCSHIKLIALLLALLTLAACSSPASREARRAAQEAAWIEAQEEAAREQRVRSAALARERQARAEERRRAREAIEQRQLAATQRAQSERQSRADERMLAREQASFEAKLQRIEELEARIAQLAADIDATDAQNARLNEAVAAAEDLLVALAEEQLKYENTVNGLTVEPLNKDGIAELRAERAEAEQAAGRVTP